MSDDDFGDTDLGLETSFGEHGSQEIAPEEEVTPTDAAGNIIGSGSTKSTDSASRETDVSMSKTNVVNML